MQPMPTDPIDPTDPTAPSTNRVAVVAVHGIADQRRGETGQAVAWQLAASSGGQVDLRDLPLPVPPLDPAVSYRRWQPGHWAGRAWKSLRQSWRSDFLDDALGAAPGSPARRNSARPQAAEAAEAAQAAGATEHGARRASERADHGVRFTDYLLAKAQSARPARSGPAEPAAVSVSAVRGPQLDADVFEMYWADLSRLPGSVTRIVAELFTLLFHLSRLGADALSLQSHLDGPGELTWLGRVQRSADWLFSRVLALLALQLVVCALVLAPALLLHQHLQGVRVAVAGLAGIGSAAALVYLLQQRWRLAVPVGLAVALAAWQIFSSSFGYLGLMLLWMGLLSWATLAFLAYCEQRFRAVWGLGMALYLVTLACVLGFGCGAGLRDKQGWLDGALGALEAVLLAHAVGWATLALLVSASVVLSEWALWRGRRAGRDHRQLLVTARLGLFTSVGAFLVVLMIGFMLLGWALQGLLEPELYTPWWFERGALQFADLYFKARTERTAGSFAVVALALLGLLGFVAIVFAPSVLRELRVGGEPAAAPLGRWLTSGYGAIERLVRLWGLVVAPAAVVLALALLTPQFGRLGFEITLPWLSRWITDGDSAVQALSSEWLSRIMIVVAGTTVGLLALGKVAIRRLQALRGPLDAALDVDNHFREFPRQAISRVRILERYVALLEHLRVQGYARVVIVAHSQGTVITADLLRYLQQRHRLGAPARGAPGQVDIERLRAWLDGAELRLLTVGSPLRQLYALRFPARYAWVLEPVQARGARPADRDWLGPQPHQLGVTQWSNLWGSGDYVGRWLWAARDDSHPTPLQGDPARYSKITVQGTDARGARWQDHCLGGDAHTHYFDLSQTEVAAELKAMVLDLPRR